MQLQYRTRYGRRTRAACSAPHGNRRLDVTDHLLALRLRQHLTLPVAAIGALLYSNVRRGFGGGAAATGAMATSALAPTAPAPAPGTGTSASAPLSPN